MNESTSPTARNFNLKRALAFLLHPRQEFVWLAGQKNAAWLTPMLLLNLMLLLSILVTGFLRTRAAAMGDVSLPVDWQWWTADMQNNYMQAIQATQGPVFLYIIPSVSGLAGLWLGWGILSGLLHLASTLLGGRGTMSSALNITAWASLPFALRDILRVIYMLISEHPIISSGFSGFITGTTGGALFFANLLKHVDLFFLWHILLLVLGFSLLENLPLGRAIAGVTVVLLISLLAQAGLGALSSSLGGLIITRPFL
jgi:hypothetical protein